MKEQAPAPRQVWAAIEIYMRCAYADGTAPAAVRSRLDVLRETPQERFYDSTAFEREPAAPERRKLRLGNRLYPHMKLVIEPAPDGSGYFFRADTHDQHIRPEPGSREYAVFLQLVEANQKISHEIETRWEESGLATFRSFLREDLARRRQEMRDDV